MPGGGLSELGLRNEPRPQVRSLLAHGQEYLAVVPCKQGLMLH